MSFISNLFSPQTVQTPVINAPPISTPQINFSPSSFSGGGLTGSFANNQYSVGANADRAAALGGVAQTFNAQAGDLGGLRQQFAPGFSQLRQTQLTALQNNRTQALGNLRDNLAQRRILGSSFAQNSLATADQEYQNNIAQTMAQTYLTELSANQQLIQQQYTAARGAFETNLQEMNLEAGIATDLTSKASSAMASAATTQAQLDMQAQSLRTQIATNQAQLQSSTDQFNAKQSSDFASGIGKFAGTIGLGLMTGGAGLGLGGLSGAAFGGGNFLTDAYGGSSSNPLPGLTAADYGAGF